MDITRDHTGRPFTTVATQARIPVEGVKSYQRYPERSKALYHRRRPKSPGLSVM